VDRAVALALCLLGLLLSSVAAAAEPVVVMTGAEADEPAAPGRVARKLGLAVGELTVLAPSELRDRIRVVSVVDRQDDAGCGGAVRLSTWLGRLDGVERSIQLLEFNGALREASSLELEVGCLDRVPRRGDLQRLYIATAQGALLASRTSGDAMQRFYAERMVTAAQAIRGLGDDLLLPSGVDPKIQRLVAEVEIPAGVRVVAGGEDGQVYVDGALLGRQVERIAPGMRLIQVRGGEGPHEVSASMLYPLEVPTLFWAGPLRRDQLEADLFATGQGVPGTELLRAVQVLLGDPVLVADVDPRGVVVRGLDGDIRAGSEPTSRSPPVVDDGPAATREVTLAWYERLGFGGLDRPVVIGVGLSGGWTNLVDPVAGDLSGPVGGLALWVRVPTPTWLTFAATAHPVARRDPLPDGYDADWLYRAFVPLRAGVRVDGTFDDIRWEAGLDGYFLLLGSFSGEQRFRAGGALAGAATRPIIDSRFALRLEAHLAAGPGWLGGGAVAGLDSTF